MNCIKGILIFFILNFASLIYAQKSYIDTVYNSFDLSEDYGIDGVINTLENNFNIRFFYDPADTNLNFNLSKTISNKPLRETLDGLFAGTRYTYIYYPPYNIIIIPRELSVTMVNKVQTNDDVIKIGNIRERGKYKTTTLSGEVTDGKTGTTIVGAVVYVKDLDKGAVTDINGMYSIELPAGKHQLQYSFVGFKPVSKEVEIISDGNLDLELFEESIALNEVVVTQKRPDKNVTQAQMGTIEINAKEIMTLPSLMGETDIIKSMTLMPGVQTIGEAATGFNIRGGNVDQNLILIEEVPIYNTSHLFGFFSTIHPGVVSDVTLYKGNVPAYYGGRISSVMEIVVKDGSKEEFHIDGGIGLINTRLTVETPIIKDKLSIIIGGRSTYSDWILRRMPDVNLQQSSAGYYDLISKLKWNINKNNSISLFGYLSDDRFNLAGQSLYNYGNKLANIKFKHIFSSRLFTTITASTSNYQLNLEQEDFQDDPEGMGLSSEILQLNTKTNLTWIPFTGNTINAGFEYNKTQLSPGEQYPLNENTIVVPKTIENEQGNELSLYVNDNYEITTWFSINGGLRYSMYQYVGPKFVFGYDSYSPKSAETILDTNYYSEGQVIKRYINPEPRLALRFSLNNSSSIKLGYNYNVQYLQLLSNTAAATPTDIWKLADVYIKPLKSNQYSLGYFKNFADNTIEASAEVYYKKLSNLIDYKNGAVVILNEHIETDILNGSGKAYGLELFIKKNSGKLTGWIGYTYSRTLKKSESVFTEELINGGRYYPASYDKPHDLTSSISIKLSRRWSMSGNFTYSTGRPVTLPEYQFEIDGRKMVYFSDRNKYRLPDYHRLDISITYLGHIKAEQRWRSSWTLSVFNVYGRKNPYSVYYTKDQPTAANDYKDYVLYKLSIVDRPIPTITYNFKF